MKCFVFVVLLTLVGFGASDDSDSCYNSVLSACSSTEDAVDMLQCSAKYGAIEGVQVDLQKYANIHIAQSFDYLLMSTHFGNYLENRDGFAHVFRKLSDSTWNDAIDLIKYITKRGAVMDFNAKDQDYVKLEPELRELHSLARALDMQKNLAHKAHKIHREATRQREMFHDPEVASYLENHFVHKHADSIRELSGHSSDLKSFISNSMQKSLALYLFDEYLQKS